MNLAMSRGRATTNQTFFAGEGIAFRAVTGLTTANLKRLQSPTGYVIVSKKKAKVFPSKMLVFN